MKVATLLFTGIPAATASCVHMQKFASNDCTGEPIEDKHFLMKEEPGAPCVKFGMFSMKDQYCDATNAFKQKLFVGPGCLLGPMEQAFEHGVCKWGVIMSCGSDKCGDMKPSEGKAIATLMKYDGKDCSGAAHKLEFPTGTEKGSPCIPFGEYSIKDQYCDVDGKFKQTVFQGAGCKGDGKDQVYDEDHCTYGFKLASCARPTEVAV